MRARLVVGVMALVFGMAAGWAQGSTLYWSGDGTTLGGTGTWDTATGRWGTTGAGAFGTAWVNANLDTAYFGGTAGTVTLGTDITVGGLRFDTRGYTISTGANTLSFGAGDNNILLNGNTPTGSSGTPVTATITNAVGGTGNVIFSFGAIQAWGGGFQNLGGFGVITLNGTSTTGWGGTTTVKQGMTLSLAGSNQGLVSTTGITLLGGTRNAQAGTAGGSITLANLNNTEAALNRVNDSAPIISYGGNITVNNTAAAVTSYSETMGALDLRLGTLNITQANNLSSGTQTLTFGSGSLTTVNGAPRPAATTSAITFSGTSLGASAKNSIIITGQANSGVGEIIAPWATYGASAGVQTDYATYNITGGTANLFGIQGAGIAGSAEDTWTTAANAYTTSAGGTVTLGATRTIAALRNTGATTVLTLASGVDLETYGILNGATTLLTVAPGSGGVLTTPAGGGNLYLTTGNGSMTISAPITDNGSDKVTVVRNGSVDSGILTLSGGTGNTFTGGLVLNTGNYNGATRLVGTQSFTGGVILNGGALGDGTTPLTAAALNDNAITVNGLAQVFAASGAFSSSSSITINSTGALDIGANGTVTVNGAVSGTGTLLLNHGNGNTSSTVILANTANTFTGNVGSSNYNGSGGRPLYVNSFGDGGKVTVGYNSGNGTQYSKIFGLHSGAVAPLIFNVRQFEMIGSAASWMDYLTLANNSAQAFTINTDLLVNALGTRTLTLQGTGAGLSTFAGKIPNGSLTTLSLTKAGSCTWVLSGDNTYTGPTTVNDGKLVLAGSQTLSDTAALTIVAGKKVRLETGVTEKVDSLVIGGTTKDIGIWGSVGNTKADHTDAVFEGDGLLYVGINLPPSGSVIIVK